MNLYIKQYHFLKVFVLCILFVAACSNDVDIDLEQGVRYLEEKKYNKAHDFFSKAIELNPNRAEPYYYLAKIAESQKDLRNTLRLFKKTVSLDNKSIDARLGLAMAYVLNNQLDFAQRQIDSVLKLDEGNQDARALLATISYKRGDLKKSVELAEAIVSDSPGNVLAAKLLGVHYITYGYENKALSTLEDANKAINGSNDEILQQLFILYKQRKDSSGAERILLQQVENHPDELIYYREVVDFYASVDQNDKAVNLLQTALENDTDNIAKYRMLIKLYHNQYGMRKAISETRNFVNDKPDLIQLRMILAKLYLTDNQIDFAEKVYQGVVDITNSKESSILVIRHNAQLKLAQTNIGRGDFSKAIHFIDAVLYDDPRRTDALMLRGQVAMQQNNHELVHETLAEIIQIQPDNTYARLQMAVLLSQVGKDDEALKIIDELLILDKNLAPALQLKKKILSQNNKQ